MIFFWSLAALMAAAALLFLLPPLLRGRAPAADPREAANAQVYREQLAELDAELARGAIGQDEYQAAHREVERRVLAERADAGAPVPKPRRATRTAIAVGLLLPLAAVLCYGLLGQPRSLVPGAVATPEQMESLVGRLTEHLQKTPQDAEAWVLLGRALGSLGHYERAAQALARGLQIKPEQQDVLVEFVKMLAMAGRAEFDARNYAAAIDYWERILPFAPADSEFAKTVREGIADARQAGGIAAGAAIQGEVSLSPALKGKTAPTDTVFILARAPGGSRMPLAVTRTTVDKLPHRYTLDDSMAMTPEAKLSAHEKVVVIARISKSGQAATQKGDIEGSSAPVAPGTKDVNVVLSRIVP